MDAIPTNAEIDAAEAQEYLWECAEAWGAGFGVAAEAVVMRGQGRGPRPPIEASLLRKMVIFEARKANYSRSAIATALGIHEKTVLRHENEVKKWMIEIDREREVYASIPMLDGVGNIYEHLIYSEQQIAPTSEFFRRLRKAVEIGIKRAGPRQVRRRRAAAKFAASVADLGEVKAARSV
jgi:hypothetical protein